MQTTDAPRLLGTSAVARRLVLSETRVRQLAAAGRLPAIRTEAGYYLFDAIVIERVAEERRLGNA